MSSQSLGYHQVLICVGANGQWETEDRRKGTGQRAKSGQQSLGIRISQLLLRSWISQLWGGRGSWLHM